MRAGKGGGDLDDFSFAGLESWSKMDPLASFLLFADAKPEDDENEEKVGWLGFLGCVLA